jgi:hypothetical protein
MAVLSGDTVPSSRREQKEPQRQMKQVVLELSRSFPRYDHAEGEFELRHEMP